MSRQREVIYGERREVLEGADLHDQVRTMIDEFVTTYVTAATDGFPEEWDLEALWTALKTVYPIGLRHQDLEREAGGRDGLDRETLIDDLKADAHKAYDNRETEVGVEVMRELERQVLLSVLDRKWREHLYEMDYLREGIGLRAYSQRDPLVEYQREGFDMFNAMKEGIREETVGFLFNLEVEVEDDTSAQDEVEAREALESLEAPLPRTATRRTSAALRTPTSRTTCLITTTTTAHAPHIFAKGLQAPKAPQNLTYSAPSEDGEAEIKGGTVTNADDPYAGVEPQRGMPLWLGQEVQEVPRRAGWTHRPHRASGRLTTPRAVRHCSCGRRHWGTALPRRTGRGVARGPDRQSDRTQPNWSAVQHHCPSSRSIRAAMARERSP